MKHDEARVTARASTGTTRRDFLVKTGIAAAATTVAVNSLSSPARALPSQDRDVLVLLFMRGGMDGLTVCVPYGDSELYNRRPTIGVRPPGQSNGAINLTGFFGLAPASAALLAPFNAGQLLFVHAAGSTDPSRSHFDAQKFMELGTPNQGAPLATGWLGRHLAATPPVGSGILRGVSIDYIVPRALAGAPATLPINDLAGFKMPGIVATETQRRRAMTSMYHDQGAPLSADVDNTLWTIDTLSGLNFAAYSPANGAVYPGTTFGARLRSVAALIKGNVGVETISVDLQGWDLHGHMEPTSGPMPQLLDQLSRGLLALWTDLGALNSRVTVVVMSEFGRRASENGNAGADHGHGGCMLLMGGNVTGGRVLTQWPGLALPALDSGDLAVTIDYRDVLSEVLVRRMGNTNIANVFPNYTPNFRGVVV